MTISMSKGRRQSEFTRFGDVLSGQLAKRGIRSHAELERRIKARGDYPRRISDETIRNYFRGEHAVPPVFLLTAVDEMNKVLPVTSAERDELEEAYAWGQGFNVSSIMPENIARAMDFITEIPPDEEEETEGGGNA